MTSAPGVVECDMAQTPLLRESMDVVVYCLALMGTELTQYLLEANRVLKTGLSPGRGGVRHGSDAVAEGVYGCGRVLPGADGHGADAVLAGGYRVLKTGQKCIHKPFDLVAGVVECDMARTPLLRSLWMWSYCLALMGTELTQCWRLTQNWVSKKLKLGESVTKTGPGRGGVRHGSDAVAEESMDVVVYCLALMGTELTQYLLEANRVLKTGPGRGGVRHGSDAVAEESMDVVVYCLALMGTELTQYLLEANRVLKTG
ncbi:putative methyltransferase domain-containing protein [Phthorimaea operculella]|nr:putative methyltransferase domain-containing protein [Phthorimaea operculella]